MRTLDWRRVWRFKDKLPRGSHYKTAMLMSRAIAEQMVDLPESTEPPTPLEYTLDTYLMLTLIDCVRGVQSAVIAGAGAEPPQQQPIERPVTALDLLNDERWRKSMSDLVDLFADDAYRGIFSA